MLTVIICAAGSGTRTGFSENKILRELNGLPVLCHSLSALAPFADEILVACRKEDEAHIQTLLAPYPKAKTVFGGRTRTESVYNALQVTTADMVLIHDAARPFVTREIIENCIESVKKYGSGAAALPVTDTVAYAPNTMIADMPPRKDLYALQTPQGFRTDEIRAAYAKAMREDRLGEFTDDCGVYAAYCGRPCIVAGDPANKKLTYREDLLPAERVGFGVDTHAFYGEGEGRPFVGFITLGGVKISSDKILKAHSDGDVVVHALMDALLSAIGERDIGYHFSDTDPAYKGANSMQLLSKVMEMVKKAGYGVKNTSISILAETPRLSPYIEEMRKNVSAALACESVGIAAGTNEKLGYVGEGKGITVYATVLLK